MIKALGCLIVAGTLGAGTAAAGDDRWIHVRVDATDGSKAKVDIQVPIGMVSGLLPILKGKHAHGNITLNDGDVDLAELREYWNAVRSAKDGEYVTVRDADSDVRISKSGGFVKLTVDEKNGGQPRPDEAARAAHRRRLRRQGRRRRRRARGRARQGFPIGEILTVDDDDSHVRIWIDAEASARAGGRVMRSGERLALAIILGLAILVGGTAGAAAVAWHRAGSFHVAVHEAGPGGDDFSITLPGLLVNAAIALCPVPADAEWNARLAEITPASARRGLAACVDARCRPRRRPGPGGTVRIEKSGPNLLIRVNSDEERVEVSVPVDSVRRLMRKLEA